MTTTWYSVATPEQESRLLLAWAGAPVENEELAGMLLDVAMHQVWHYAPESFDPEAEDDERLLPPVADVPLRLVYAQLQQAKNLWAAGAADETGNIGTEGYSFVPRPLDKTIRAIIRPTSGAADVV